LTDQEHLASEQRRKNLNIRPIYQIRKSERRLTLKNETILTTHVKNTLKNEVLNINRNRQTKNAKLSRKNDKDSRESAPKV
jgi:hypothetical protein